MFTHRFFGGAFYGDSYFGDGIGAVAPSTPFIVDSVGSYVPYRDSDGTYAYSPASTASYVPNITSGGTP